MHVAGVPNKAAFLPPLILIEYVIVYSSSSPLQWASGHVVFGLTSFGKWGFVFLRPPPSSFSLLSIDLSGYEVRYFSLAHIPSAQR